MGIPARGAAVQAARWAPGRNGAQRWPRVGTAPLHISAPPPFRSTFLRQKSRAAFQGWRRGAGEAAQFLARHGTKQLIYTRSALCFRAEAPAAARTEEGKEWLAPWWADWLAAPWRQLPVCCPATLCCWRQPPNFPLHLPTSASLLLALTRTLGGHIRSACEACCGGPCYAHHPTTTTTIPCC